MEQKIKELLESEKFVLTIDEDNKEEKEEELKNLVNNELIKLGLEVNWDDFDFNRIYKSGYQDKENWDEYYITSFQFCYNDEETKLWIKI